ncbi:thiol reductant ABC exporter subunit CydC, partial [Subtercola sp. Z020]|uniref:ABC transporter transmembrane domain-containing protein n=1 Tax=Subtercola sp. Z020 TaxID=2080582 RepID=UPI000D48DC5F
MRAADVLRMAQPAPRAFAPALVFGLLGAVSAVALLGTSAYLIARAAEQPPILYLSIAIVGVRGFALARASFRYLDRLAAHSAAFRALATLRVAIYERLVPLAPAGLARTRRGDLLARLVGDVDELQNFPLRVVQPLVTSLLVAGLAVVGMWLLLPAAAVALAVALLLALVVGTVVHTAVSSRAERELAPLRGSFADETLDVISNLDVLTAFGAVDARLARLERSDARLTRSATRRAAGAGAAGAVLSLLAGLATVASLALGIAALTAAALAVAGSPVSDATTATAATVWGGAGVALGGAGLTGPVLAVLALLPIAVFEVFAAVPLAASAWRQVHASAARVASALPATL